MNQLLTAQVNRTKGYTKVCSACAKIIERSKLTFNGRLRPIRYGVCRMCEPRLRWKASDGPLRVS